MPYLPARLPTPAAVRTCLCLPRMLCCCTISERTAGRIPESREKFMNSVSGKEDREENFPVKISAARTESLILSDTRKPAGIRDSTGPVGYFASSIRENQIKAGKSCCILHRPSGVGSESPLGCVEKIKPQRILEEGTRDHNARTWLIDCRLCVFCEIQTVERVPFSTCS